MIQDPVIRQITKYGSSKLLLGNLAGAHRTGTLKDLGVKTVLSVVHSDMNELSDKLAQAQILHRVVDLPDKREADVRSLLRPLHAFIKERLQAGSVLVHCVVGVSRSATVVLAFMMLEMGWGFDKALSQVRKKKEDITPNVGFMNALIELGEEQSRLSDNKPKKKKK